MAQRKVAPLTDVSRRPLRVLAVDDHEDSRVLVQTFLSLLGFTVYVAADADEALRMAASFRPDVVFLDVWMPGMSGVEACRRLRAGCCPPPIPIYAVTADWKQIEAPERCFDRVLPKPLDLDLLAALVREREAALSSHAYCGDAGASSGHGRVSEKHLH